LHGLSAAQREKARALGPGPSEFLPGVRTPGSGGQRPPASRCPVADHSDDEHEHGNDHIDIEQQLPAINTSRSVPPGAPDPPRPLPRRA
jgi:hypothetical protein